MVATRALVQDSFPRDAESGLRNLVRDLVALSTLPAVWIRADPPQVAKGLGELMVSLLDADFAFVRLPEHAIETVEYHNRTRGPRGIDFAALCAAGESTVSHVEDEVLGRLNAFSVPIGRIPGARLVVAGHRPGFPDETERTLMRVAASQAAVVVQRWNTEQSLIAQKRSLELLNHATTALYRFTDQIYRAQSDGDVFDAALATIVDALECPRASILMFDDAGTMRFVASRGLSEQYRNAVDGHSPWNPGDRNAEPICVSDIDRADLSESLRAAIRAEGIRALAFIPIIAAGAVIGKFMTYYDAPHSFESREFNLALTIARQLGFAVERRRAEEARRSAEEFNRSVVASSQDCIKILDLDGKLLMMAEEGQRLLCIPDIREFLGKPWIDFWSGDYRKAAASAVAAAAAGRPGRFTGFFPTLAGTPKWWDVVVSPVYDANGDPERLLAISRDITEHKHAEEQRELLLAELSHRVKNTLATVISIARQSLSVNRTMEEARLSFEGRIRALAQTHTRLAEANWSGVSFETILRDEFAPYQREDSGNVRLCGPEIILDPRSALMLGMAAHELVTNAAKYGALSTRTGVVDVTWKVQAGAGEISICWLERGGPKVSPPSRRGFGRILLERALASDLKGRVVLNFDEDGLKCSITLPLAEGAKL